VRPLTGLPVAYLQDAANGSVCYVAGYDAGLKAQVDLAESRCADGSNSAVPLYAPGLGRESESDVSD
jgi:hypothetical protein